MIQKPILSGRLGKWAYSLVEYDLSYELLKAVKGQVMADFIVNHNIDVNDECLVAECPWSRNALGHCFSTAQSVPKDVGSVML
jgi:hypothetical protein